MAFLSSSGFLKRACVLGILMSTLASVRYGHAITPRQLVEVADLGNLVMSPDGRRYAVRLELAAIERNALDSAWYVQDVDGAAPPLRLSDGGFVMQEFWGLPASAPAVWAPDGRWIFFRAMIGGKIDVWRAATDGSGAEPVTLDDADVREFELSADGRMLKYSIGATREQVSAAERAEYDRGVRIDRTATIGQPLFRSGYIDGRLSTQRYRSETELDRVPLLADVQSRWKAIDLRTGERRDIGPPDVSARPDVASLLPKDHSEPLDFVFDQQRERVALLIGSAGDEGQPGKAHAELAMTSRRKFGDLVKCEVEACKRKPITSIQWRPNSDEVLFTVTDPDKGLAQSILRWNAESGAVHSIVESRGFVNGGRDERSRCAASAHALVCVTAEADRPPRIERIDLESGESRVLFDPNAALASRVTIPARLLRWEDQEGHTFTGQLFAARRKDGRKPPLFVTYYRCEGFLRGGTGDEWPLAAFAEAGISALCINRAPTRLDAVQRYDLGLAAVRGAVDLLRSAREIDGGKIGMGGLSFGTEVTLWTVVNSDLLAAASVSSVGQTPVGYDLRRMYDNSFFPALRKYWQLGSPDETAERWKRLSLVFNLDKVRAPIMMLVPEQEYLLSVDYAVPLIQDQLAELYVFPDEAHFKFLPRHKVAVYERNLDWFKFWLLDEEAPGPEKREQYVRWRAMRDRLGTLRGE